VPRNASEERAIANPRAVQPGAEREARAGVTVRPVGNPDLATVAFLIGLGPPEVDDQALRAERDVTHIQADDLGPPHCGRKAQQDQGSVPKAQSLTLWAGIENTAEIGDEESVFSDLRDAEGPADTLEERADLWGSRGAIMASSLVSHRDSGQELVERLRLDAVGSISQVESHHLWLCRQRLEAVH